MIHCPECGTENDAHARFCDKCGHHLEEMTRATETRPVAGGVQDASGQMVADDGLPLGEDLDGAPGGERILWRGRPSPFLSPQKALMNRYKLTNERMMVDHGFIGRRTEEVDLYRVNDVAVKQNALERMFGIGDIKIFTSDASAPEKNLFNVSDPDRVKDLIRGAARIERQRRRVLLRDEV